MPLDLGNLISPHEIINQYKRRECFSIAWRILTELRFTRGLVMVQAIVSEVVDWTSGPLVTIPFINV
jgi:hypothetical protein